MNEPQVPQHSSIPQFLLDTEHPWIIKHQSVLARLPDVESFIYSPPGTKHRTPVYQLQHHDASTRPAPTDDELDLHLEVPADLFNTLNINNDLRPPFRAGWPNARSRLLELQRCPAAALARVRSLEVKVWVQRGAYTRHRCEHLEAEEWQDLEGPAGDELLDLFASVLTAMTGLERLRWAMLPEFAGRFREGLVGGRGLWLASVRRLEVAPLCEYMVDACPNVEVLECEGLLCMTRETDKRYAEMLVEAAAKLPKVKEFSVKEFAHLTPSFISAMVKSMPGLVRIRLDGRIPKPRPVRDPDTGEKRAAKGYLRLKDILPVLAEFSGLEELHLPNGGNLNMGVIYGGNWCGTNFFMLSAAAAAEENYREERNRLIHFDEFASIVLEALPQLKRLILDGREPTITHGEDGKASATWPWSGRSDEYLNEILGRPKA